jgi:DNA-binding response OmpR family regulator
MPGRLAELIVPIRVLVIEADAQRRAEMKLAIEAGGYDVETAADDRSAVLKVCEGQYDLVLVVHGASGIDGPTKARLLSDLARTRTRYRLIASAATRDGMSADEAVFDGVTMKPPDMLAVLEIVDCCLQLAPVGPRRSGP